MKKLLIMVLLGLSANVLAKEKIKVSLDFIKAGQTKMTYNYLDFYVTGLTFTYNEVTWAFTCDDKHEQLKNWSIFRNEEKTGTVQFEEMTPTGYRWVMKIASDETSVSFDDLNDPRRLDIESLTNYEKMVIPCHASNLEPDCNSVFSLYVTEEDEAEVATGSCEPCKKADWLFEIKEKDLRENFVLAYIFSAVVAQNVRGLQEN